MDGFWEEWHLLHEAGAAHDDVHLDRFTGREVRRADLKRLDEGIAHDPDPTRLDAFVEAWGDKADGAAGDAAVGAGRHEVEGRKRALDASGELEGHEGEVAERRAESTCKEALRFPRPDELEEGLAL